MTLFKFLDSSSIKTSLEEMSYFSLIEEVFVVLSIKGINELLFIIYTSQIKKQQINYILLVYNILQNDYKDLKIFFLY